MKKQLSKHLTNYHSLGSSKADYRQKVMDETGWKSTATFYNKLSGAFAMSKIEAECVALHFNHFNEVQNQIKKYAKAV